MIDNSPIVNHPPEPVDFRAMVRAELDRQSATVKDLARASNISYMAVWLWLSGRQAEIGCDKLARMLAVLRIDARPTMVGVNRQVLRRDRKKTLATCAETDTISA